MNNLKITLTLCCDPFQTPPPFIIESLAIPLLRTESLELSSVSCESISVELKYCKDGAVVFDERDIVCVGFGFHQTMEVRFGEGVEGEDEGDALLVSACGAEESECSCIYTKRFCFVLFLF